MADSPQMVTVRQCEFCMPGEPCRAHRHALGCHCHRCLQRRVDGPMTEAQSVDRWRTFGEACRIVARLQLVEDRVAVLKALGALGGRTVQMMANAFVVGEPKAAPETDGGKEGG